MEPTLIAASRTTAPHELPALVCTVAVDTTRSLVHLDGDLDLATGPLLESVVEEQVRRGHVEIRVDLSQLAFCDVRGLSALLGARRRLVAAGGRLVLLRPPAHLRRLGGWCGAADLLDDGPAAPTGTAEEEVGRSGTGPRRGSSPGGSGR